MSGLGLGLGLGLGSYARRDDRQECRNEKDNPT
jgi:hypothetical protein